ncbi:hypothetical protein WG66_016012, partial [Moniliophthora roreri]
VHSHQFTKNTLTVIRSWNGQNEFVFPSDNLSSECALQEFYGTVSDLACDIKTVRDTIQAVQKLLVALLARCYKCHHLVIFVS